MSFQQRAQQEFLERLLNQRQPAEFGHFPRAERGERQWRLRRAERLRLEVWACKLGSYDSFHRFLPPLSQ